MRNALLIMALSSCASSALVACNSQRDPHRDVVDARSSMGDVRTAYAEIKTWIGQAKLGLREVLERSDSDPKSGFTTFAKAEEALARRWKSLASSTDAMHRRTTAYLRSMDDSNARITDAKLAEASATRSEELRKAFDDVGDDMDEVDAQIRDFSARASDLRTYLATDIAPASISAAEGRIEEAIASGTQAEKRIDELLERFGDTLPKFGPARYDGR